MPDIIKQKAIEEQERKRQLARLAEMLKAVQTKLPERKVEWVEPERHKPGERPRAVPLPNHTGEKGEVVLLPFNPNEPIRMQKLPYLFETNKEADKKTGGKEQKPAIRNTMKQQKAQAAKTPALFDFVSPLSKSLSKIMALSKENPKEAGRLRKIVQESAKDPDSPIFRPYARPTNKAALQELSNLGIDTANINRDWFEKNAWLGQYARTDTFGLPVPPKQGSSKEETAAYYYTRLLNAQGLTQKAEAELGGLKREIGYWANRKDRNYSDGEVLSRIDWNNYPALSMLRRDQQKGLPTELNKAIDFDRDTEIGMLWSARNGKTSGSNTIDAAKYALGEGQSFVPDDMVRSQRDPQSPAYNPYALGSTAHEAAQYFQVDAFDLDWLKKNRRILDTGNETAIRMYNTVENAERFTRQAEAELNDLNQAIDKKLDLAAVSGRVDASGILRDAFVNYPALRRMDEGRLAGQPAPMTRALHYRAEDIARVVGIKAEIINRRMGSTKDSRDLEDAAQNEKAAVIADQGNALQRDIAPRSLTAPRSLIWEDGLLAATPYTLNNGVDPYAPDAASTMTAGEASGEAEAEERLTQAGQYGAAAKAGYQKLMSALFQGGETLLKQDLSALASVEGAVSSAARVIINAAKGHQTGEAADEQTQEGYDHLAEKLLGISPVAVSSIASFIGAAVGKIAGKGAAGLVSLLMETGAAALGAITKNLLEGEEQPLSFLQTLSRLLQLRKAATGEKTDGEADVKKALTEAVSRQMEGVRVSTGHGNFDTIATVAAQKGNSMDTVQKRWGDAGINYFANLMEAGRSDIAAVLQTLPSYARAVVVAEQNMRTVALSPGMLMGQLAALKLDSEDPYIMKNAERRARLQAENGLMGQRIAGGALSGLIPYQKAVEDAQAKHDRDLLVLDKAGKTKQIANRNHDAASALFLKNPADASAVDGLSMAIDQMVAAGEKWKTAEQAAAGSQKVLSFAQFRLDTQNQQAMANLADEVKKEIDQKVKDADLTAEFEGLIRERMPVGGVSKEKQDAAFQFVRKMTDHFKTLNPQDQRTLIDLTKKYRAGSVTEDELKTLNILNPDFVLDLSMPKHLAISATHDEKAEKEMETVSKYLARIQNAKSISELNAITQEVYGLNPASGISYLAGLQASYENLGAQAEKWQADILDAIQQKYSEFAENTKPDSMVEDSLTWQQWDNGPVLSTDTSGYGDSAAGDRGPAGGMNAFGIITSTPTFGDDLYKSQYGGQAFSWDHFDAVKQMAEEIGGEKAGDAMLETLEEGLAAYFRGKEVKSQVAIDWLVSFGFFTGNEKSVFDDDAHNSSMMLLGQAGNPQSNSLMLPMDSFVWTFDSRKEQPSDPDKPLRNRQQTQIGQTIFDALQLIDSGPFTQADQKYIAEFMIDMSRDYEDAKGADMDAYYAQNPQRAEKFTTLKALAEQRVQASFERDKQHMEELYTAVTSGKVKAEQIADINALMSVDISDFAASDMDYLQTDNDIFNLCMEGGILAGDAISTIGMNSYNLDMHIAYALGLSMDAYYTYYPERKMSGQERYDYATVIYNDIYQRQLGKALSESKPPYYSVSERDLADLIRQEVDDIYFPKPEQNEAQGGPGIGFFVAADMGIEHGVNAHILSVVNAVDFYFLMQDKEETKASIRGRFETPQEYRKACEDAIAAMHNPEEKKMWTERMNSVLNIFDLGLEPSSVQLSNFTYDKQQYMDSKENEVYEKGTRGDYRTFQVVSGVADMGLTALEVVGLTSLAGGGTLGKVFGNFLAENLVASADTGIYAYEKGSKNLNDARLLSVSNAVVTTGMDLGLDYLFDAKFPDTKQGKTTESLIEIGTERILSNKSGSAYKYLNELIVGTKALGEKAVKEGTKKAISETMGQFHLYMATGDFSHFDGGAIVESYINKAVLSSITYLGGSFFDENGKKVDLNTKLNTGGRSMIVMLICHAQGGDPGSNLNKVVNGIIDKNQEPTLGALAAMLKALEEDGKNP